MNGLVLSSAVASELGSFAFGPGARHHRVRNLRESILRFLNGFLWTAMDDKGGESGRAQLGCLFADTYERPRRLGQHRVSPRITLQCFADSVTYFSVLTA